MTHKNSADGGQRFVSAIHDIEAATTMNMRINESRRNEQPRSVNMSAIGGNSDCPGIANCRNRGVFNEKPTRRDSFSSREESSSVDRHEPFIHVRFRDDR